MKMLIGDKIKYWMLVSALSLSVFLMTQQGAVFTGLMRQTGSILLNTNAPIWVVDPNLEQVNEAPPLRDTDLARVRSVSGVQWAMPIYSNIQQARLYGGEFDNIQLMGVDAASLIGLPSRMYAGRAEDLRTPNAVLLDKTTLDKWNEGNPHPIGLGDSFDVNDHEAKIVGIFQGELSFFGRPFIYTTYNQAIEFAPRTRKNLGFIIVHPLPHEDVLSLARRINEETGLKAYTQEALFWKTIHWFFLNTGILPALGTTIFLGFVFGIAVSGQTFYSFFLENLGNFGALRVMGASNWKLITMLLLQVGIVGLMGFGIGTGMAALFGIFALKNPKLPFYMPMEISYAVFCAIIVTCAFCAGCAVRKFSLYDPVEVFRN